MPPGRFCRPRWNFILLLLCRPSCIMISGYEIYIFEHILIFLLKMMLRLWKRFFLNLYCNIFHSPLVTTFESNVVQTRTNISVIIIAWKQIFFLRVIVVVRWIKQNLPSLFQICLTFMIKIYVLINNSP